LCVLLLPRSIFRTLARNFSWTIKALPAQEKIRKHLVVYPLCPHPPPSLSCPLDQKDWVTVQAGLCA
jgi:hypothetical protein